MMNLGRRVSALFVAVLLLALSAAIWSWYTNRPPGVPPAAGLDMKSIPLPEIRTRAPTIPESIEGLLRELNVQQSAGITPDQNSAVLLIQAFGIDLADPDAERGYMQMLGIDGPFEDLGSQLRAGDFLTGTRSTTPSRIASDAKRLMERCEQSGAGPWTEYEYKDVAAWLAANQPSLSVVAIAVQRPTYYQPLITPRDKPGLLNIELLLDQKSIVASKLLASRAMLRLRHGQIDAACDDILTCIRLGRLIGQGPHAMSQVVAAEIENRAFRAAVVVIKYGRLSAEAARQFAAGLDKLAPIQRSANVMDFGERKSLQDCVQRMGIADSLPTPRSVLEGDVSDPQSARSVRAWTFASLEVDKVVKALEMETYAERKLKLAEISREYLQFKEQLANERERIAAEGARGDLSNIDRWNGKAMAMILMPSFELLNSREWRRRSECEVLKVSLALEASRADLGSYPMKLDELVPEYLSSVPLDLYSGNRLRYDRHSFEEATSPRYLLYSVFEDQEDDGGVVDHSHPEQGDLVIDLRQ